MGGVLRVLGLLLIWVAVAMLPPTVLAVRDGIVVGWAASVLITLVIGGSMLLATEKSAPIDHRGSLLLVALSWLSIVGLGALPFILTRTAPTAVEGFFESVSGFTTTGATVFADIESLPRSILLWRSTSHWIGGMGIIVLSVAILPFLGVGGAQLFRAEAPGIPSDRLTPRIASTARLLWTVYTALTAALAVLYLVLGMDLFDAVNHAMSTLATGGFSTRTASMGAFSPGIQWVTILFMFAAGANFALHYRFFSGRASVFPTDPEFRMYLMVVLASAVICFLAIRPDGLVFRDALFNVMAIMTTTGYATQDFALWPVVSQAVLLGLMFIGAMGGSTGGGFKVVRVLVLLKHTLVGFRLMLHPNAVALTRLGRRPVSERVMLNVVELFALYIATHALGTLALAALGLDLTSAISAAIAAMSSVGPALGSLGPASHYGDLSGSAQLVLTALMLLGRLEFYTLLIIFVPDTWRTGDSA